MQVADIINLLKNDAEANIRGGASKLRWDADNVPALLHAWEPRQALETWWWVLDHYNGGTFNVARKSDSNYPFRVYNALLSGVTVNGDVRVPQIPVTLPPHFFFRKGTAAETDGDAALIPHTPPAHERM